MITIYIALVAGMVYLVWAFISEIRNAPEGWEDESKFHYGKEPTNNMITRSSHDMEKVFKTLEDEEKEREWNRLKEIEAKNPDLTNLRK
jgi:hypothetical protein